MFSMTPSRLVQLLVVSLCLALLMATAASPLCAACNQDLQQLSAQFSLQQGSHHFVSLPRTDSDHCNGCCSCCGFVLLAGLAEPPSGHASTQHSYVLSGYEPLQGWTSPLHLPPRS
jgi:hypothetical protein